VIGSELKRLFRLSSRQATDTVAPATSMAGGHYGRWQYLVPRCGPFIAVSLSLRMDCRCWAQLTHILEGLLTGYVAEKAKRK
jgi:hypothetical protein